MQKPERKIEVGGKEGDFTEMEGEISKVEEEDQEEEGGEGERR